MWDLPRPGDKVNSVGSGPIPPKSETCSAGGGEGLTDEEHLRLPRHADRSSAELRILSSKSTDFEAVSFANGWDNTESRLAGLGHIPFWQCENAFNASFEELLFRNEHI